MTYLPLGLCLPFRPSLYSGSPPCTPREQLLEDQTGGYGSRGNPRELQKHLSFSLPGPVPEPRVALNWGASAREDRRVTLGRACFPPFTLMGQKNKTINFLREQGLSLPVKSPSPQYFKLPPAFSRHAKEFAVNFGAERQVCLNFL